jgi:hypothetical protein
MRLNPENPSHTGENNHEEHKVPEFAPVVCEEDDHDHEQIRNDTRGLLNIALALVPAVSALDRLGGRQLEVNQLFFLSLQLMQQRRCVLYHYGLLHLSQTRVLDITISEELLLHPSSVL